MAHSASKVGWGGRSSTTKIMLKLCHSSWLTGRDIESCLKLAQGAPEVEPAGEGPASTPSHPVNVPPNPRDPPGHLCPCTMAPKARPLGRLAKPKNSKKPTGRPAAAARMEAATEVGKKDYDPDKMREACR